MRLIEKILKGPKKNLKFSIHESHLLLQECTIFLSA